MPLLAQDIIDRARNQMQDVDGIAGITPRYSETEMLSFVTLGVRSIVRIKPSADGSLNQHICTATPRQRLDPTLFHSVLRVQWNYDELGFGNAGRIIQTVERDVFDTFYNMWPVSTAVPGETPTRFVAACMDAKDPLAFWLFPTPRAGDTVYLTASAIPDELTATDDEIYIGSEYVAPLVDFVCHMASLSVGRDEAAQHAERYLVRFLGALGVSTAIIQEVSTNQPAAPEATE